MSVGFHYLSRIVLGISINDTQSGLKLLKRDLLEIIMPLVLVKRYAFDLELCFLAEKHGFRTVEAPIKIDFKGRSNINAGVAFNMFKDMLAIRYRYTIKRYYQKKYRDFHLAGIK